MNTATVLAILGALSPFIAAAGIGATIYLNRGNIVKVQAEAEKAKTETRTLARKEARDEADHAYSELEKICVNCTQRLERVTLAIEGLAQGFEAIVAHVGPGETVTLTAEELTTLDRSIRTAIRATLR